MAKQGDRKTAEAPKSIQNRRARYDYAFQETHEAGVSLVGSEVKSIYLGKAHLTDSYCRILGGEIWLINMDVEPYDKANVFAHERRRDRKLLMHRREIDVLDRKATEKGFSIIPLGLYFKNGRVKVEVGLGRGKAHYDKREKIAKDDERREVDRAKSGRE